MSLQLILHKFAAPAKRVKPDSPPEITKDFEGAKAEATAVPPDLRQKYPRCPHTLRGKARDLRDEIEHRGRVFQNHPVVAGPAAVAGGYVDRFTRDPYVLARDSYRLGKDLWNSRGTPEFSQKAGMFANLHSLPGVVLRRMDIAAEHFNDRADQFAGMARQYERDTEAANQWHKDRRDYNDRLVQSTFGDSLQPVATPRQRVYRRI